MAVKNSSVSYFIGAVFLCISIFISYSLFTTISPIISIFSVTSSPTEAHGGDTLTVTYVFQRNQECPSVVFNYWIYPDGTIIERMPARVVDDGRVNLTPVTRVRKIVIPKVDEQGHPVLGTIIYKTFRIDFCGMTKAVQIDDISIQITA